MAAEFDNLYNEKYTRDDVLEILSQAKEGVRSGTYVIKEEALLELDFTKQLLYYWKKKRFVDDNEVLYSISEFEDCARSRTVVGSAKGDINPQFGKFLCQSVYGMVEKGEELKVKAQTQLIRVHSVSPDGTKVEKNG